MKKCIACNKTKQATKEFFTLDKRKEDGLQPICRDCSNARLRARRAGIKCVNIWNDTVWVCRDCGETKPLDKEHFKVNKNLITGFDSKCRVCSNKDAKEWKKENLTEEDKKRHREVSYAKRQELKIKCIHYLGSMCIKCGVKYDGTNAMIFDFHHRNPTEKEFQLLTQKATSFEHNKPELDKCDLLCANCHRKEHSVPY
jgi:hypothetical protein